MKLNFETQKNIVKYIINEGHIGNYNQYTDYFDDEKINKLFRIILKLYNEGGRIISDVNIISQELTNINDKIITDEFVQDVLSSEYTIDKDWLSDEYANWYKTTLLHKEFKKISKLIMDGDVNKAIEKLNLDIPINEDEDIFDDDVETPLLNQYVYDNLPELLKQIINYSDDNNLRERDVLLLSSLTVISTLLDNVGVRWYKTLVDKPNMYLYVSANAGGGKGIMQKSINLLHEYQINEEDKLYETLMTEYNNSDNKKGIERPVQKSIEISGNSSKAAIFQLLKANNSKGIIFMGESESMTSNSGNDWAKFDDILNSSFHNEQISSSRVGELIKIKQPYLSFCASGTFNQLVALLNKSIENGLVSRMTYYIFNSETKYKRDSGQRFEFNVDYETADEAFKVFSKDYYNIFLFYNKYYTMLFDKLRIEFTIDQVNKFDDRLEEMFEHYTGIYGSDYDATLKRFTTTTRKILMVLTIIRHYENNKDYIISELTKLKSSDLDDIDEIINEVNEINNKDPFSIQFEDGFDTIDDVANRFNLNRTQNKLFDIFKKVMSFNDKKGLFEIFIDEIDLDIVLDMMDTLATHSKYLLSTLRFYNSEDTNVKIMDNNGDKFFNSLKTTFTTKDAIKIGSKFNLSDKTVQRRLKSMLNSKLITKIKFGLYVKNKTSV